MTARDPYFVERGRVDGDRHIRVVDSSLRMMHNTADVYGNPTSDNDAVTGPYTYPPPSEYAEDDRLIICYYNTGGMMDLIDSDPPSPIEDEAIPQITAAAGDSEGDRRPNLQLDGASFTPEALIQKRPIQATSTNPPASFVAYTANRFHTQTLTLFDKIRTNTRCRLARYHHMRVPQRTISLLRSRDALPPAEQDRRPLPQRSAVPRTGTATRQLPAAYNSYATGPIRASVPTASPQGTLPPVNQNRHQLPARWPVPYADTTTRNMPVTHGNSYATGSLLASLPNANPQVAQAPMVQQPNGFTGSLQHYNCPYRTNNGPTSWVPPPPPPLTLPNGSMVGRPISYDLQPAFDAIRRLPIVGATGHPQRSLLKKPFHGSYTAATRDAQLIRDNFASGSGLLKADSPLRHWYGDLKVFEVRIWEFLAVQKARR